MNELLIQQIALWPREVRDLLKLPATEGLCLTLVGGAIRDILLGKGTPSNLDFEIRPLIKGTDSFVAIKRFQERLQGLGLDVVVCPFGIIRVQTGQFELEFAPPRLEIFGTQRGHKNFDAEFCFEAPYEVAWKRRDFTVNAIGLEISDFEALSGCRFINPFDGAKHLEKKELHLCDKDFSRDPVRFCRAIRFRLSLGFSWGSDLMKALKNFDLSELSIHYFFSEAARVNYNPSYFELFFEIVSEKKIPLNSVIAEFALLQKVGEVGVTVKDAPSLLAALAQVKGANVDILNRLGTALGMKKAESSAVYSLYCALDSLPQGFEKRFRNHLQVNGPSMALGEEALFDKVLNIVILLRRRGGPPESAFAKKLASRLHFLRELVPHGDYFKGHEELDVFLKEEHVSDSRIVRRLKWFFHFKKLLGNRERQP